jgi:hypothetical protein
MSHALTLIEARIRNIENILKRIHNGEYPNLRHPDQCRTAYCIILVSLEQEKYEIQYS